MNEILDVKTYETLYLRYIQSKDFEELLSYLGPLQGMTFLDLCCGNGILTKYAFAKGINKAVMVDIVNGHLTKHAFAEVMDTAVVTHIGAFDHNAKNCFLNMNVRNALQYFLGIGRSFDRVGCRQAVNYWLDDETAKLLASVMNPKSIFVFNTFNQKPSEKPRMMQYELEGHNFVEVSWLIKDMVHHIQIRDEYEPHHSVFRWIAPEEFRNILTRYFEVEEFIREKTSFYQCTKK